MQRNSTGPWEMIGSPAGDKRAWVRSGDTWDLVTALSLSSSGPWGKSFTHLDSVSSSAKWRVWVRLPMWVRVRKNPGKGKIYKERSNISTPHTHIPTPCSLWAQMQLIPGTYLPHSQPWSAIYYLCYLGKILNPERPNQIAKNYRCAKVSIPPCSGQWGGGRGPRLVTSTCEQPHPFTDDCLLISIQ